LSFLLSDLTFHSDATHIFFFSSRRRHTRSKRDWSSDVCSSDLSGAGLTAQIGTTLLAWRYTPTRVFPTHWFQARSANWAVGAGLLMLGLAVALQLIVPDWQWWAEASAFSAICVLTGGLMLRDKARLLSISTEIGRASCRGRV